MNEEEDTQPLPRAELNELLKKSQPPPALSGQVEVHEDDGEAD